MSNNAGKVDTVLHSEARKLNADITSKTCWIRVSIKSFLLCFIQFSPLLIKAHPWFFFLNAIYLNFLLQFTSIPGSDIWPSANQNEAAKINRVATVKPINKLFSDWFFMISLLLFLKGLKYLTTSTFTSKPTILYIFTLVSQTEVIVVISYINDDFSSQVLLSNSERAVKAFATHYIIFVVCQ